jgi:hypothetical protein
VIDPVDAIIDLQAVGEQRKDGSMNINKPGSARNARRRDGDIRHREHLKALCGCGFNAGAQERTSADGSIYYERIYRSPRRSAFLKKRCTRMQRRTPDLPGGNAYRKASEYWWDLN